MSARFKYLAFNMKDRTEVTFLHFPLRFPQLAPNLCLPVFFRHGECPTPENTETFIRVCEHFSDKNPSEFIGMSYIHLISITHFYCYFVSYLLVTAVS